MSAFDIPFGHFVRVLANLDLAKEFSYKILVERVGFSFFVDIEYEKVPQYCSFCSCTGNDIQNCKRKEKIVKGKNVDGNNLNEGKTPPDPPNTTNVPTVTEPKESLKDTSLETNKENQNNS